MGSETFGLWSTDVAPLLEKLAVHHVVQVPEEVRREAKRAFKEHWWGTLAVSQMRTIMRYVLTAGTCITDSGVGEWEEATLATIL